MDFNTGVLLLHEDKSTAQCNCNFLEAMVKMYLVVTAEAWAARASIILSIEPIGIIISRLYRHSDVEEGRVQKWTFMSTYTWKATANHHSYDDRETRLKT